MVIQEVLCIETVEIMLRDKNKVNDSLPVWYDQHGAGRGIEAQTLSRKDTIEIKSSNKTRKVNLIISPCTNTPSNCVDDRDRRLLLLLLIISQ